MKKINAFATDHPGACLKRGKLLFVLIMLLSLLTACGGADFSRSIAPAREAAPPAPGVADFAEAEAPAEAGLGADEANLAPVNAALGEALAKAQQPRVIIYTGNMTLIVRDTAEAIDAITILANEQGGHVAGSNVYHSEDVPRGSITIRVPAESYQDTLAKLRALAVRVRSESTSTEDVTQEFTDLEARKTNLEVAESALQELLDERRRVGSTSDILEVYRELTNIRGQIEQIEGRLRYLANQSALSTITIELIPDVLSQPVTVAGWQPQGVAKTALQALIAALQGLANILIWVLVFVLPLLLVILIPIVIFFLVVRWGWRRYRGRKESPTKPVEPVAEASREVASKED